MGEALGEALGETEDSLKEINNISACYKGQDRHRKRTSVATMGKAKSYEEECLEIQNGIKSLINTRNGNSPTRKTTRS